MYYFQSAIGRAFARLIVFIISVSLILQSLPAWAKETTSFSLPKPGQMVALSPSFSPVVLKGIKLDPQNPFRFHFYVDKGDMSSPNALVGDPDFKNESQRLIKYFLASLTIPEKDLWVNLSPYEKDRIIPDAFGQTEMGRDLLAQDYILKQITASLIYPESQMGKAFWDKVYKEAKEKYGTTEIPINTFNKVWIVPEKAVVYENNGVAYVMENRLKVMLEEDYKGTAANSVLSGVLPQELGAVPNIARQVVRDIVIPALTKEVNEGKNFAQLRQVFYSLILATWYKKKIKDSILNKVYADKAKVGGVGYKEDLSSPNVLVGDPEHIYQQYLQAFKKGVFNYIKEDVPLSSHPRKYFSGGVVGSINPAMTYVTPAMISPAQARSLDQAQLTEVTGVVNFAMSADAAMTNDEGGLNLSRRTFLRGVAAGLTQAALSMGDLLKNTEQVAATAKAVPGLTSLGTRAFWLGAESFIDPFGFVWRVRESQVMRYSIENPGEAKEGHLDISRDNLKAIVPGLNKSLDAIKTMLADLQSNDKKAKVIKGLRENIEQMRKDNEELVLPKDHELYDAQDYVFYNGLVELTKASDDQLAELLKVRIHEVMKIWQSEAQEEGELLKKALDRAEAYQRQQQVKQEARAAEDKKPQGSRGASPTDSPKAIDASGENIKLPNPVSKPSFAEGEARVKQLTGNSLIQHLYKRGDVDLDSAVEFVRRDHPLKEEIFDRLDQMTDDEVIAEIKRVLVLPHANDARKRKLRSGAFKGLHLYSSISLRELLLHPTYGQEDMRQLLAGLGNYASSELDGYKGDIWVLNLIEHTYLLFRAIEVLSRQFNWDLFSKEDLDRQGGLLNYLIEFGSYEDAIKRFLNFSSDVLVERLDKQDMRSSIEIFFALLDKLQQTNWPNEAFNANAKEWQRVLSLNEPYRDNIKKLRAALKPASTAMSVKSVNAAMTYVPPAMVSPAQVRSLNQAQLTEVTGVVKFTMPLDQKPLLDHAMLESSSVGKTKIDFSLWKERTEDEGDKFIFNNLENFLTDKAVLNVIMSEMKLTKGQWDLDIHVVGRSFTGMSRRMLKIQIVARQGAVARRQAFAFKFLSPFNQERMMMTEEDVKDEWQISKKFEGNPFFRKHFSRTLIYKRVKIDLSDVNTIGDGVFQLDTFRGKQRLSRYVERQPYELARRALRLALGVMVKGWVSFKRGQKGLIYDNGWEDIMVEDINGALNVVFVDANGEKDSGGIEKLFKSISALMSYTTMGRFGKKWPVTPKEFVKIFTDNFKGDAQSKLEAFIRWSRQKDEFRTNKDEVFINQLEQYIKHSPDSAMNAGKQLEGMKIYLIEDDVGYVKAVTRYLQNAGAEVTAESNGASADLFLRKAQGNLFDVIILDLNLQDYSGMGIVETIRLKGMKGREGQRPVPIIINTGIPYNYEKDLGDDLRRRGGGKVDVLDNVTFVGNKDLKDLLKSLKLVKASMNMAMTAKQVRATALSHLKIMRWMNRVANYPLTAFFTTPVVASLSPRIWLIETNFFKSKAVKELTLKYADDFPVTGIPEGVYYTSLGPCYVLRNKVNPSISTVYGNNVWLGFLSMVSVSMVGSIGGGNFAIRPKYIELYSMPFMFMALGSLAAFLAENLRYKNTKSVNRSASDDNVFYYQMEFPSSLSGFYGVSYLPLDELERLAGQTLEGNGRKRIEGALLKRKDKQGKVIEGFQINTVDIGLENIVTIKQRAEREWIELDKSLYSTPEDLLILFDRLAANGKEVQIEYSRWDLEPLKIKGDNEILSMLAAIWLVLSLPSKSAEKLTPPLKNRAIVTDAAMAIEIDEPQLRKHNLYAESLRHFIQKFSTSESIARLNLLKKLGPRIEEFMRKKLRSPQLKIMIVPLGSTLKGYAAQESDVEYAVSVLSGLRHKITEEESEGIFGEINKMIEAEGYPIATLMHAITDVEDLSEEIRFNEQGDGLVNSSYDYLFLPVAYGDKDMVENYRREFISYCANRLSAMLWERFKKAYYNRNIDLIPMSKEKEKKRHFHDWLRGMKIESETQIRSFQQKRSLPSLEEMMRIYGVDSSLAREDDDGFLEREDEGWDEAEDAAMSAQGSVFGNWKHFASPMTIELDSPEGWDSSLGKIQLVIKDTTKEYIQPDRRSFHISLKVGKKSMGGFSIDMVDSPKKGRFGKMGMFTPFASVEDNPIRIMNLMGKGIMSKVLDWYFWELSQLGYSFQNSMDGTSNFILLQMYARRLETGEYSQTDYGANKSEGWKPLPERNRLPDHSHFKPRRFIEKDAKWFDKDAPIRLTVIPEDGNTYWMKNWHSIEEPDWKIKLVSNRVYDAMTNQFLGIAHTRKIIWMRGKPRALPKPAFKIVKANKVMSATRGDKGGKRVVRRDAAMKAEDVTRSEEPLILDGYLSMLNYKNWLLNFRMRKLIKQLNDPASDKAKLLQNIEPVRKRTLYYTYTISQGTVSRLNQTLIGILKSPDPVLQQLAIKVLAKSGDLQTIEFLIPFLSDGRFRMDAIWSIAQIFRFEGLIKPYASREFIETLGDRKGILIDSLTAYMDHFDIDMHKKDYARVLLPIVLMAGALFDIRHLDPLLRLEMKLEQYKSTFSDPLEQAGVIVETIFMGGTIHDIKNKPADGAMKVDAKGGIDMNPSQMSLQVRNEGEGFKFDFNGVDIDAAQVTGAEFIINDIKPVTNLLMELGLPASH